MIVSHDPEFLDRVCTEPYLMTPGVLGIGVVGLSYVMTEFRGLGSRFFAVKRLVHGTAVILGVWKGLYSGVRLLCASSLWGADPKPQTLNPICLEGKFLGSVALRCAPPPALYRG